MEKFVEFENWICLINPWVILSVIGFLVLLSYLIFIRFFAKTFVVGKGFCTSYQPKENDAFGTVISAGLLGFVIAKPDYLHDLYYDASRQIADDTRKFATYSPQYARIKPRFCLASDLKIRRFLYLNSFFNTKLGRCLWAAGLFCQIHWNKNTADFITQERFYELDEYNNFGLSQHLVLITKISWWKYFSLKIHELPLLVEYADGVKSYKLRQGIRPVSIYLNKYIAVNVEFLYPNTQKANSSCTKGYMPMNLHYAKPLARKRYDFDYTVRALGLHSLQDNFINLGNDYFYHFPFGFLKKEDEDDWLLGNVAGVHVFVKCSNSLLA